MIDNNAISEVEIDNGTEPVSPSSATISDFDAQLETSCKTEKPNYIKGFVWWFFWIGLLVTLFTMVTFFGSIVNETLAWMMTLYIMILYFVPNFVTGMVKRNIRQKQEKRQGTLEFNERNNQESPVEGELDAGEMQRLKKTKDDNGKAKNPPRIYFLDNLKILLTGIIVSHQISCSFGGCGPNTWPIIIGLSENEGIANFFNLSISFFALMDETYLAPLFFFISGHFIPSSYTRKENWEFHYDKCTRLVLPCILSTLMIYPATVTLAQATMNMNLVYIPDLGPTWFLLWLSLFSIIYSTLADNTPIIRMKMPGTILRSLFGLGICGASMFGISLVIEPSHHFLFMPLTYVGTLVCNISFFLLGIVAYHSDWLQTPIRDQLDIPVWLLRTLVVLEALAIYAFWVFLPEQGFIWRILSGLFSVDYSLTLMEFFQSNVNWQSPSLKSLSESAYGVYLLHPIIVVCLNAISIDFYRVKEFGTGLVFDGITPNSYTLIAGPQDGGLVLFLWWILVNIASHVIIWPLVYRLKKLPLLRAFL